MALELQPMQACLSFGGQTMENAVKLGGSDTCFTVVAQEQVIACLGLVQLWPGRRMAWAYLSAHAGPYLVPLTWKIRRWLKYHGRGRIETAIDPEFRASERWAIRLGFKNETPKHMEQWIPGKDFDLYARVR